jgi:hypothetical protein
MNATRIGIGALLALAASTASGASLESQVLAQDGWTGYRVPMVESAGRLCCFRWEHGDVENTGCDLDSRSWHFGSSDKPGQPQSDGQLAVYLHVEHGRIDRVHAMSNTCPVRSAKPVHWLDGAAPAESVALLARSAGTDKDDGANVLAAIAYHGDAAATSTLGAFAKAGEPGERRRNALFWLGQARGAAGADIIERAATTDPDPSLREHAIFALSQSHAPNAYPKILAIAQTDASARVRSQGLFWLAQMHDPRARTDIVARIKADPSRETREQAVFALTQLKDGENDAALIALIEGDYPKETKKQALFWLGQSGSAKAIAYFDKVLK